MIETTIGLGIILILLVLGFYMYDTFGKIVINSYKYFIKFDEDCDKISELPIIKVKMFGKDRYFLVDSGANDNVIDERLLFEEEDFLNIQSSTRGKFITASMKEAVDTEFIKVDFKIGRDKFIEQEFTLLPLEGLRDSLKQECGKDVIGVLGYSFFKDARWVVDFEQKVIWVKKKQKK